METWDPGNIEQKRSGDFFMETMENDGKWGYHW